MRKKRGNYKSNLGSRNILTKLRRSKNSSSSESRKKALDNKLQ